METDAELKMVISIMKSIIVSVKGGLPFHKLDADYLEQNGQRIQYSKFGFRSLEDFVRSIAEVRVSKEGGSTMLSVVDPKMAHIKSLLDRQKPAKKRIRPTKRGFGHSRVNYGRQGTRPFPKAVGSSGFPYRPAVSSPRRPPVYAPMRPPVYAPIRPPVAPMRPPVSAPHGDRERGNGDGARPQNSNFYSRPSAGGGQRNQPDLDTVRHNQDPVKRNKPSVDPARPEPVAYSNTHSIRQGKGFVEYIPLEAAKSEPKAEVNTRSSENAQPNGLRSRFVENIPLKDKLKPQLVARQDVSTEDKTHIVARQDISTDQPKTRVVEKQERGFVENFHMGNKLKTQFVVRHGKGYVEDFSSEDSPGPNTQFVENVSLEDKTKTEFVVRQGNGYVEKVPPQDKPRPRHSQFVENVSQEEKPRTEFFVMQGNGYVERVPLPSGDKPRPKLEPEVSMWRPASKQAPKYVPPQSTGPTGPAIKARANGVEREDSQLIRQYSEFLRKFREDEAKKKAAKMAAAQSDRKGFAESTPKRNGLADGSNYVDTRPPDRTVEYTENREVGLTVTFANDYVGNDDEQEGDDDDWLDYEDNLVDEESYVAYHKLLLRPKFRNHQLIGDDFLLHFANYIDEPCREQDGCLICCGLCISGQTVATCLKNIRDTDILADRLVLLVGAIDIIQGVDFSTLKLQLISLLNELVERKIQRVYICTIPRLVRLSEGAEYVRLWYNKTIRFLTSDTMGVNRVIDLDAKFVDEDGLCTSYLEENTIQTAGNHISPSIELPMWNHHGLASLRALMMKCLV